MVYRRWTTLVLLAVIWHSRPAAVQGDDLDFHRDLRHTVAARRALFEDKDLGPLNLGVKVQNRVATLWGPVPSADLAQRAIKLLEKLPDLIGVKNELEVEPPSGRPIFLPDVVPDRIIPPLPPSPVILTTRPVNNIARPISQPDQSGWKPLATGRRDPRIPDDREIDSVISALPVPPPVDPYLDKSLADVIQDLRRDKRFNMIRIEAQGDVVYLRAEQDQGQNVYELAAIIARLSGVKRVVVQ